MAANKFQVTSLDFDANKAALIAFLKTQTEFTDYNFEGSGFNAILDLLSYNNNFTAYLVNMVSNEMFLDSADLRQSVVSLAKHLGYTPQSRRCARATVNVVVTPTGTPPAFATMDKNCRFSTSVNGKSYVFVSDKAYTAMYNVGSNSYTFNNVTLLEGLPYVYRYTVNLSDPTQRFLVPTNSADTNTLAVTVQASNSNSQITAFSLADDINTVTAISPVFFLQEVESEQFEVKFGDGVIGLPLVDGNIVNLAYLICNADAPNYANSFTPVSAINGFSNIQVTTVSAASGGSEREDIDSVRFHAPKRFEAQNRAVTVYDYKRLLTEQYPNIESISVWGGESNIPPSYGNVFVSIKPKSGFVITQTIKNFLATDILSRYNVVTVVPKFVDPEYLFLMLSVTFKYDSTTLTTTSVQLENNVRAAINSFGNSQLLQFNRIFQYSKLLSTIDTTNSSITSNLVTVSLKKKLTPIIGTSNYSVNFDNAIIPGSVVSSIFVANNDPSIIYVTGDFYHLDDDGFGNIRVIKYIGVVKKVVRDNAGTINYSTGQMLLTNFYVSSFSGNTLDITADPVSNDVSPLRNTILVLEDEDVSITSIVNPISGE